MICFPSASASSSTATADATEVTAGTGTTMEKDKEKDSDQVLMTSPDIPITVSEDGGDDDDEDAEEEVDDDDDDDDDEDDDDDGDHGLPKASVMIPTIPPPPLVERDRKVVMPTVIDASEHWNKASAVLRENPSLMTQRVLMLALQRQPPTHVIKFMISVNPKSASVLPKHGLTPLQVAVRHRASVEVIEALLEACPFSLCVTNPENMQDPLSFAKKYRSNEPDLIELLSRPIGYWVSKSARDPDASIKSFSEERRISPPTVSSPPESLLDEALRRPKAQQPLRSSSTSSINIKSKDWKKKLHVSNTATPTLPTRPIIDRQELNNVKLLCAQVLKNHRRLAKRMDSYEERLESVRIDKENLLQSVQQEQMQQFYRQLLALEMKERSMRAHVEHVHHRCLEELEARVQDLSDTWNEIRERDHWQYFDDDDEHPTTPFVYATPLGETKQDMPLMRSVSDNDSYYYYYYSRRRQQRRQQQQRQQQQQQQHRVASWKPFRHWDHIKLREEQDEF